MYSPNVNSWVKNTKIAAVQIHWEPNHIKRLHRDYNNRNTREVESEVVYSKYMVCDLNVSVCVGREFSRWQSSVGWHSGRDTVVLRPRWHLYHLPDTFKYINVAVNMFVLFYSVVWTWMYQTDIKHKVRALTKTETGVFLCKETNRLTNHNAVKKSIQNI